MTKKTKQSFVTLKIKTLHAYTDMDVVLLHAAFQVLRNFIELEQPGMIWPMKAREIETFKGERVNRRSWSVALKEMRSLYKWWTKERPARKDLLSANKRIKRPPRKLENVQGTPFSCICEYDKKKYAAYTRLLKRQWHQEIAWDKEDNENLHRLVNVRQFMWT
jgi:hypothetical protein